ncbi:GNAT family N-acetyltransferase [Micromonospora phytophila]|uniref:GNAT family N-acetyltransferase n=1 Tax=Micromonospora phytophila TaxID=709888 RepID=UPI00202EAE32|nr:GNAT family N-acetyltransferase [Micromonospora phytophila]MCM0674405.1 GNAT family N-acetyltransferase [Micromonospora phytophila]
MGRDGCRRAACRSSGHAHVYAVYVSPAHRGPAGPAAALMAAAIRFARDHTDAGWLTLGVHEDNPRARGFYRKLGFAETGKAIPYALNPSQKVHIMGYQDFGSARRRPSPITRSGSSARRRPRRSNPPPVTAADDSRGQVVRP